MIGLASRLEQGEGKRGAKNGSKDPGGALGGCGLFFEETWRRAGSEEFPRLSSYSELTLKCQVVKSFPQLVRRAPGCPKTSKAFQWESPWESPENEVYRETI